jgi:hypothetical protein
LQRRRLETDSPESRIDLNFYTVAVVRLCTIAERAINFPDSDSERVALGRIWGESPTVAPFR